MKKMTAMLLSLMMCFSLLAIPAQAAFIPDPDGPGVIDAGGPRVPADQDDEDSDNPGNLIQPMKFPEEAGEIPVD